MFTLLDSINHFFIWLAVIFIIIPLMLMVWASFGFILSMFLGPLGYIAALIMMLYFSRNF